MTPQQVLAHLDAGTPWPADHGVAADGDLVRAQAFASELRGLRVARGEAVVGYKIGWTNRTNWARMGVAEPMWSALHAPGILQCDGHADLVLDRLPLPRLEPEVVVGFARAPGPDPSFAELFDCLAWLAPGFEIVQSHLPDWRYTPAQTIADSAVHARLVIGRHVAPRALAADGDALADALAQAGVNVSEGGAVMTRGVGANVLDGPLHALRTFVRQLAAAPGAPALTAGDLVTTGTWTDAQPLAAGETWRRVRRRGRRARHDRALAALTAVTRSVPFCCSDTRRGMATRPPTSLRHIPLRQETDR